MVPVDLQALVVNKVPQAYRRWPYNYEALSSFDSPEPEAGGGQSTTETRKPGVYLHWELPDALRHGDGTGNGNVTYPKVPNRWLVVRLSGSGAAGPRTATGWVVESDCPNQASPTMYLVDPTILDAWTNSGDSIRVTGAQTTRQAAGADGPLVALLGQAFPLSGAGWQERAPAATFLTAVAPGNVLFSKYEPHCANVFTFYDAMTSVADGDQVTYLVVGWYSQPDDDILATTTPAALGWAVAGNAGAAPTTSLYQGLALDVPWKPEATTVPPTPLTALAGNVHAGVGNTTVDAFTALVAGQLQNPAAVDLLRAFQYGLLPELEEVNGPNLLATAVHQAAFGSRPRGLTWEIVAAGDTTGGGTGGELTPAEANMLVALNRAQAAQDAAQASLDAHRWALYALWWKLQKGNYQSIIVPPDGFDPDAYQQAITVTLPALLAADAQAVAASAPYLPQPVVQPGDTRQDSFERGIAQFAAANGPGPGKVLKAAGAARTWRSGDPVVVLSGVQPAPLPDASTSLPCRLTTGLVTTLQAGGTGVGQAQLGTAVPTVPGAAALSPAVPALLLEAFLLDPASAPAIAPATQLTAAAVAAAITGHPAASYPGQVLPARGLDPWAQQPWQPLLMEWQVGYVPIPQQTDEVDNWAFDGDDYRFVGDYGPFASDTAAPIQVLGGIVPLSPEAQFTFRAQLQRFVATYVVGGPGTPADLDALADLQTAIDGVDRWRFMSQALAGLGDLVALRDGRAHTAPDASVAGAVAGRTGGVPYIPNGPVYPFDAVRQGQLAVQLLLVYDTFGQVLPVVGGTGTTDPQNFAPTLDPAVRPDKPVISRNPGRLIELRPRLMQHSRLDLTWVDGIDDTEVTPGGPGNPVIAWLLPNHLDQGLLLYSNAGRALGEVRLLADASGTRSAQWQPPPHDPLTLTDVQRIAPRLWSMITDAQFGDPDAFRTFLAVIDTTLWSVDPLGDRADQNLSVLIGRPLALTRAGLRLSVDGQPLADMADWSITWPPPTPEFVQRDCPIRLGDQASRQDGLVGYYVADDWYAFTSVADPGVADDYVKQQGPIGSTTGRWLSLRYGDPGPTYVSLLLDPRAAVHAVTGLLPAKAAALPARFVRPALANLELTFRVGSLLTHAEQPPGTGDTPPPFPQSMWLPHPTERNGTWSWWERASTGPDWSGFGLLRATPDARLKDYPSTLRDGFLQFDTDLDEEQA